MKLIPLFHFYKLCIFVWLSLPPFNGAMIVYKNLAKPLLTLYNKQIHQMHNVLMDGINERNVHLTPSYCSSADFSKRYWLNYISIDGVLGFWGFGSYARNENREFSDIDILVKFKSTLSLLQLVHVERLISQQLGIKVDLITVGALKNQIVKDSIGKDLQIIYQW